MAQMRLADPGEFRPLTSMDRIMDGTFSSDDTETAARRAAQGELQVRGRGVPGALLGPLAEPLGPVMLGGRPGDDFAGRTFLGRNPLSAPLQSYASGNRFAVLTAFRYASGNRFAVVTAFRYASGNRFAVVAAFRYASGNRFAVVAASKYVSGNHFAVVAASKYASRNRFAVVAAFRYASGNYYADLTVSESSAHRRRLR
eukprot:s10951_g1.t1